jgi:conjugal transfer/type IV secretion protein DotA/TraY
MLGKTSIQIEKKQVLRYMLTPQITPRLRDLFGVGFTRLALMIALVYRALNILPTTHPLLRKDNREKLTVRTVIAAAANEIEFSAKNIDKIVIYAATLIGLVLLAGQFFLTLAYLMSNPAFAGNGMPTTYGEFFQNPDYQEDVAYQMLFSVFGVPELFSNGGDRNQYHIALHSIFQLYSVGLLVIAVIIGCYYVFAVAVETAQTGVPFGKRFNHVWAPIRFVVALGLLIPIGTSGYGLNSAQWITLYAAKFGSDFATKGWTLFNEKMTQAYLNSADERVGTPQAPEFMPVAAYMMTVDACMYMYRMAYPGMNVQAYLVRDNALAPSAQLFSDDIDFEQAHNFFGKGDILIRFGVLKSDYHQFLGSVKPVCGDLVFYSSDTTEPGALFIQSRYFTVVKWMLGMAGGDVYRLRENGENLAKRISTLEGVKDENAPEPPPDFKASVPKQLKQDIENYVKQAVQEQAGSQTWQKDQQLISQLGWGGAGIWYNKIAQINGSLVTAVGNVPQPKMMPWQLEVQKAAQLMENGNIKQPGSTSLANNQELQAQKIEKDIGEVLSAVQNFWSREDIRQDQASGQTRATNNIIIDAINAVLGTRGLFNMCANADTHPLAQLSILGKGLVEASIRNLALATAFGAASYLPIPFIGPAAGAASSMLVSVATITISIGFLLFYVLPFMPFLYFFFAVGGWIKGLFEAMVGVPLWALAHLRIDGEGLPGDAAMDGYYLILEIFLRPILIIFGLLASVIIFAGMVKVLNEIFYLVVNNLSGHDSEFTQFCKGLGNNTTGSGGTGGSTISYFRGPVDELFFTIIYAIIVFLIGMSCFKLIDLVPNNLLRYMGKSLRTFNDTAQDPAEGLMGNLSVLAAGTSKEIIGAGQQGAQAVSGAIKGAAEFATPKDGK